MRLLALDTSTLVASVAVVTSDTAPRVLACADSAVDTHSDNLLPLIDQVLTEASCPLASLDAIAVGAGPGSFTGLRIGMATAKGLAFAAGKPLYAVSSLASLAMGAAALDRPGTKWGQALAMGAAALDRPGSKWGQALAADPARCATSTLLVPVLDARRDELFAGFYTSDPAAGSDGSDPPPDPADAATLVLRTVAAERVLAPDALDEVLVGLARDFSRVVLFGDGVAAYPEALATVGELWPEARPTPSAAAVAALASTGEAVDVLVSGAPTYLRPSEAEIRFPNGNPGWNPGRRKRR